MKPETASNVATTLPVAGGNTSLSSEVEILEIPVGGEGISEPQGTESKDKLWAELDADGESKVKVRLAMSYYGDVGARRALVLEWLRTRVKNEAVDVRAAAAAAQRHARSAARRTREAKRAKRRTTIALIFATLSAMGVVVLVILSLAE